MAILGSKTSNLLSQQIFQATSKPNVKKNTEKSIISKIATFVRDFFLGVVKVLTCNWCGKGRVTKKTREKPDPIKPESAEVREKRIEGSAFVKTLRKTETQLDEILTKLQKNSKKDASLDELVQKVKALLQQMSVSIAAAKKSGKLLEKSVVDTYGNRAEALQKTAETALENINKLDEPDHDDEIRDDEDSKRKKKEQEHAPKKEDENLDERIETLPVPGAGGGASIASSTDHVDLAVPKKEEDEKVEVRELELAAVEAQKKELAAVAAAGKLKDPSERLNTLIESVSASFQELTAKKADLSEEMTSKVYHPYETLVDSLSLESRRIKAITEYSDAEAKICAANLSSFAEKQSEIARVATEINQKVKEALVLQESMSATFSEIADLRETAVSKTGVSEVHAMNAECMQKVFLEAEKFRDEISEENSEKLTAFKLHMITMGSKITKLKLLDFIVGELIDFLPADIFQDYKSQHEALVAANESSKPDWQKVSDEIQAYPLSEPTIEDIDALIEDVKEKAAVYAQHCLEGEFPEMAEALTKIGGALGALKNFPKTDQAIIFATTLIKGAEGTAERGRRRVESSTEEGKKRLELNDQIKDSVGVVQGLSEKANASRQVNELMGTRATCIGQLYAEAQKLLGKGDQESLNRIKKLALHVFYLDAYTEEMPMVNILKLISGNLQELLLKADYDAYVAELEKIEPSEPAAAPKLTEAEVKELEVLKVELAKVKAIYKQWKTKRSSSSEDKVIAKMREVFEKYGKIGLKEEKLSKASPSQDASRRKITAIGSFLAQVLRKTTVKAIVKVEKDLDDALSDIV